MSKQLDSKNTESSNELYTLLATVIDSVNFDNIISKMPDFDSQGEIFELMKEVSRIPFVKSQMAYVDSLHFKRGYDFSNQNKSLRVQKLLLQLVLEAARFDFSNLPSKD